MSSIKQRWVLDPSYVEDRDLFDEVMQLQQDYSLSQDSYFTFDPRWMNEDTLNEYPLIYSLIKENSLKNLLILVSW